MKNWFLHKLLKRPYSLYSWVSGAGDRTIVLLHGIGANHEIWDPLIDILDDDNKVVAFDLLGFGKSPIPEDEWIQYSTTDHAKAVIHSLQKLKIKGPITLVGHSMGCLVAVEIVKLKPRLVDQLFLYEPPFYQDLPERKSYLLHKKATFKIFKRILESDPTTVKRFPKAQKVLVEKSGIQLSDENRVSYKRSLQNTIINQTAVKDIKRLSLPITIIYGRYDRVVINDKNNYIFGNELKNLTVKEISAGHSISQNSAQTLSRIISNIP